jgi:hypothetical protein
MDIEIKEVSSRKDLREFVFFPEKVHKNHPNWMPPLYSEDFKLFDAKKNPSFEHCDTRLLMAFRDGKMVGRIMGIIHHKHNGLFNLKNVRFGYLECYEDEVVFNTLLKEIMDWGRAKGMNKIIGPYGFSDKDVQGFQIAGFDDEPVIDSANNWPYMIDFMERAGFVKEADCFTCEYDLGHPEKEERYKPILQRILDRPGYEFLEFTSIKPIKKYIVDVFNLVNESFGNIYGFVPMDQKEIDSLVKQYLPIIDPRFVKLILHEKKLVGFLVALPRFTKGIQKAKGRLFPFGFIHILRSMKKATKVDLMLGAVHPKYQGKGLDLFLSMGIIQSGRKYGIKYVDTHLVLDGNDSMESEMVRFGAKEVKRYRVYQKQL